jgi:hypothetical protein
VSDPAEPWEIAVPKRDRYKIDLWLPGRPFRPTKPQELPPPALPALEAVCGSLTLPSLFVVPRTTRLAGPNQCVITPAEVLGFGELAVGL